MDRKPPPVPMKDPRDRIPRSPSSLTSSPNISRSSSYNNRTDSPLGSPEPERRPSSSRPVAAASSSLAAPPSPSPQAAANGIHRAQTAPVPAGAATPGLVPPEALLELLPLSTCRTAPMLAPPRTPDLLHLCRLTARTSLPTSLLASLMILSKFNKGQQHRSRLFR